MDPRDRVRSRNLIDRYRAAAEKHTSRPAIASRTAIAPVGIKGQIRIPAVPPLPPTPPPAVARKPNPVVCTVPLNHCREAVPPSPTVAAGAALGRVDKCRLWMNRRQRRQPPRPTAPAHRLQARRWHHWRRASPSRRTPPAPPLPAIFAKIPLGLFGPPAPPWPPNEFVTSPNVARPVLGSAHESAGEIHRQIAASATGAAIAASDIVIMT